MRRRGGQVDVEMGVGVEGADLEGEVGFSGCRREGRGDLRWAGVEGGLMRACGRSGLGFGFRFGYAPCGYFVVRGLRRPRVTESGRGECCGFRMLDGVSR